MVCILLYKNTYSLLREEVRPTTLFYQMQTTHDGCENTANQITFDKLNHLPLNSFTNNNKSRTPTAVNFSNTDGAN